MFETSPAASGIAPIQRSHIVRLWKACPECGVARVQSETIKSETAAMNGKSSKFASTILSALLYTQVLLCVSAFTLVVLKDRVGADPVVVASVASQDAQVR